MLLKQINQYKCILFNMLEILYTNQNILQGHYENSVIEVSSHKNEFKNLGNILKAKVIEQIAIEINLERFQKLDVC